MSDVRIVFSAETQAALAAVNRLVGSVQGAVTNLASSLVAGLSVGALVHFIDKQIEAADQAGKTAQKIGLSTEAFTALAYAAKLADVAQDELVIGLKTLAQQVVNAARGSAEAALGFSQFGIGVKNGAGGLRTLQELLPEIADKFAEMPDGIQKTDLAVQFFGRSGIALIPLLNEGSAGLAKMGAEGARFGAVISGQTAKAANEFNDNLEKLKTVVTGFGLAIAVDILPSLKAFTDGLMANSSAADQNKSSVHGLATVLRAVSASLVSTWNVAQLFSTTVAAALTYVGGAWADLGRIVVKEAKQWANSFRLALTAIGDLGPAFKALGKALMKELFGGDAKQEWNDFRIAILESGEKFFSAFAGLNDPNAGFSKGWKDMFGNAKGVWVKWWEEIMDIGERQQNSMDAIWRPPMLPPEENKKLTDTPLLANSARDEEQRKREEASAAMLAALQQKWEEAYYSRESLLQAEHSRALETLSSEAASYEDFIRGKELLDATYARKKADLERELEKNRVTQKVGELGLKISNVQSDPFRTKAEKVGELLPLLNEQNALLQGQIEKEVVLAGLATTDEDKLAHLRERLDLMREQAAIAGQIRELSSEDFTGTIRIGLTTLTSEWENVGANLANNVLGGIRSAVNSVGDAIVGVIDGTHTWGQAFGQVGKQIISNLITVVAQWIASMTIVKALKTAFNIQDKTDAATSAAAHAPGAAMASTESYGAAAVIGAVALAAILALAVAGAAGAFAEGGTVRGPGTGTSDSIVARLSNGEEVINAKQAGRYRDVLKQINAGIYEVRNRPMPLPLTSDPERMQRDAPGLLRGSQAQVPNVNVQGHEMHVVMLRDQSELREFLESNAGKNVVIKHVRDSRDDLGFQT
jgi:hypothetical protein